MTKQKFGMVNKEGSLDIGHFTSTQKSNATIIASPAQA
jgi:hypothetical protein